MHIVYILQKEQFKRKVINKKGIIVRKGKFKVCHVVQKHKIKGKVKVHSVWIHLLDATENIHW